VFVTFKVSTNGKRITNPGAGIAVKCKGGAGGFPSAKPGSGKITRGTFKVVLMLYPPGPAGQKSSGTDTVTGKFVRGVARQPGPCAPTSTARTQSPSARGVSQTYTAIGMA
jgi:hypothetical protein